VPCGASIMFFHLAALVSVAESMQKPFECAETNTIGTLVVAGRKRPRAKVKRLVLSSSAAPLWLQRWPMPKVETMPPEPKSPRPRLQSSMESLLPTFFGQRPASDCMFALFQRVGPRARIPAVSMPRRRAIFIDRALKNEPLTIYGDGKQTRDFIFVKDIVAANAHFALEFDGDRRFQCRWRKEHYH